MKRCSDVASDVASALAELVTTPSGVVRFGDIKYYTTPKGVATGSAKAEATTETTTDAINLIKYVVKHIRFFHLVR